jgi:hypothetical protein
MSRMQSNVFVSRAIGMVLTFIGPLTIAANPPQAAPAPPGTVLCAPSGKGYLQAKIAGAITAEIAWRNEGTVCTGETRPDGRVRLSFKNKTVSGQTLLIVFGIPGVREGRSARALPANLTVVREGAAEFFSTQGDDKCTIDSLEQQPLQGAPHRKRRYRVTARGFCTEPAREVNGDGAVLVSRFDFVSELHFGEEAQSETKTTQTFAAANHPATHT